MWFCSERISWTNSDHRFLVRGLNGSTLGESAGQVRPAPFMHGSAVKTSVRGGRRSRGASKSKMRGSLSDVAVVDSRSEGGSSEGDGSAFNARAASGVVDGVHGVHGVHGVDGVDGVDLTTADEAARLGVDDVILGALKKHKFNLKIKEIEEVVRRFVLGAEEPEFLFDLALTQTTFERLLAHRVAQHWGLETRVLEDRETIVATWPKGKAREAPEVELGSLPVVVDDPDGDEWVRGRGGTLGRRRAGGRVDAARGGHGVYDAQMYFYQQMMYQHQQMIMYQMMHQQGMGSGVPPAVQPSAYSSSPSPSHGSREASEHPSPTRQMPESPASSMSSASNGRVIGGAESPGMPVGNSPIYPPVFGGYGGPPMMMGGGVPPYGVHVPVVPIMLPDGRIVYQQQPIQPVAVPPPPPPPPPANAPGSNAASSR